MDDNSGRPQAPEDRATRALPYVVGLLVAFGLLIYNSTQQGTEDSEIAQTIESVSAATRRAEVGPVRRALDRPEFAGVEVGEYDGTIVLTGEVADDATRAAAEAAARAAAGGSPVDDRLRIAATASNASPVTSAESSAAPVTAAASTIPSTAAEATAAATVVPETTLAPETTLPETTAAPETTAVPETTVAAAPSETTAVAPAPAPETTAAPAVPEPSADELDARLSELLRAQPVQFELLASRIDAVSFPTLDQAVALINSSTSARFEVQGHTDSGGQTSFNQRLSEQRAASVRQYLIDHGVAAERVVAVGYGESRPVARNATPEGRSLNRRVEIVVLR